MRASLSDRPLLRRAGMIAVLLLLAGSVLGGIGFGVYLLVRPDPPAGSAPAESPRETPRETTGKPPAPEESGPAVTSTPPPTTNPTGTGSVPTSIEDPGGNTGTDLDSVARAYVDAVNSRDEAAAIRLTCERTDAGTLFSVTEGRAVTLVAVEVLEGTVATAQVRVGDQETALLMENQEDGWCVAI